MLVLQIVTSIYILFHRMERICTELLKSKAITRILVGLQMGVISLLVQTEQAIAIFLLLMPTGKIKDR